VILLCMYFFGESPNYCYYNAEFFFLTNDISLVLFLAPFWVIFVALCLQTVLNAGSDKGQKKLELPS
jgi:hypothetical protein